MMPDNNASPWQQYLAEHENPPTTTAEMWSRFASPYRLAYGEAKSGLSSLAQRAMQPPNARTLMQAALPGWQLLPHLQNIQPKAGFDFSGMGHEDMVGHFHSLLQEMHRRGLFGGS